MHAPAASVLAAQGKNLGEVALTMFLFGLLSREAMAAWRGRLLGAGSGGKAALGALLIAAGILILTGLDKVIEAKLVAASPA